MQISSNLLSYFLQVLTLFSIRLFQYNSSPLFPLLGLVLTTSISATRKAALANNLLEFVEFVEFVSTLIITLFTCQTMLVHSFYVICSKCCYASDVTFPQNLISFLLHLAILLPKQPDFGDFAPAPEVVTKNSWLGGLETVTLPAGCSGFPNLYFYLLQSSFLCVSLYLSPTKCLGSGQCIFNPHQ